MITIGINPDNLKEEIELIKEVFNKLGSKIVWKIVLTLSENGGAMTETEIAHKLNKNNCSNLSPHINFLLAINMLKSENDNEQLTKGTRVYLNERYNGKRGYTIILDGVFDNMTTEEFKEKYYPQKNKKRKDCEGYERCKNSVDNKNWSCANCKFFEQKL